MRISKKAVAYTALTVVVLLALFFLALPPLIKHLAIKKIDETTGRKSEIAKVSLNPFTLTARVSGFRLSEKGSSSPFISFSSARVALSPLSLPKRSFIIKEVHLASPYVHLVRNAPNNFNFTDLVAPKKEQKKEGSYLFSLNNITIDNGSVDFEDRALRVERDHRIRGMKIAVPFVSNMAYLADRYVTPHFSAVVNGSPFRFDGRLKPLTRAVEATVSLNLKGVDLPFYLGYLPSPLPVKVVSGKLDSALELGYRVDEKKGPEALVSGALTLNKLAVEKHGGAPVTSLERGGLRIRNAALLSRQVDLDSIELEGLELYLARDRAGAWNLKKLTQGQKSAPAPEKKDEDKKPQKKPLDLKLAKLSLKGGKLHFSDALPQGGFKTELHDIDLDLKNLSLAQGQKAPLDLKFATSKGESAAVNGDLTATPVTFDGKLDLQGIPLKEYYPYLRETLTAPVTGKVNLTTQVTYSESNGVVIGKGTLRGEELAAPFGSGEGFRLKEAVISGIAADLKKNRATVERVDLKGGKVTLSSDKKGDLSAKRLFRSGATKEGGAAPKKHERKKPATAPFSYRVQKVTGSDLAVDFTDRGKEEAPRFALHRIKFSAADIAGPKQGAIPFTLAAGYGKSGRLQAGGHLTPQPLHFKGNVELHGIPLRDFDAYIPEDTTVFIAAGSLDTVMALNIEKGASGFKGNFNGSLGVRSFYCQDTELDEDLLKWERLQLERVNGTLAPFTLAISNVSLANFYSRVIVEKDGTLNLQHLREEEAPAPAQKKPVLPPPTKPGAPVQSAAVTGEESPAQPHPIRIDAVTVQGGTLAFSDRHLDTPFDTTFYNLGGRVSGLTSQANRFADVDLRGNLENHSPLSIKGVINPLRGDLYLDLQIAFNDIELSPLTPYSNTYLGYEVDKGKLFLNLSYKIDKKSLSSQNKVFIDQFTFGKQVESAKATKLPVKLAIALLKDRKGEIHLDLPVAGRTDDPQFSVWKVVLQILKNLLVKAATSPMALLGSVFGGGGQDFSAVVFAPGSEQIAKPEQEKLLKLAHALQDRPALNVEISGFVERERDAEGYKNEILLKKMKGEKFRRLVKEGKSKEGQTQQETEILPQEYSRYLKEVYSKEKFPKPRNAVGFQKSLPDEEMKKLIIAHTTVGQNELQALAQERAQAVKAFLMREGKIPAERLYLKSADIFKPPAKEIKSGSRVEFGASVK